MPNNASESAGLVPARCHPSVMRAALLAVVLLLPSALVHADEDGGILAAPDHGVRAGWMFGANVGRGRLDIGCTGCRDLAPLSDALSIGGHLGRMLTPRLAALVDVWIVRYADRDNYWFGDSADHVVEQRVITGGAQLWLARRWWLRAGIGAGHHRSDADYAQAPGGPVPASAVEPPRPPSPLALATAVAGGVEVIHRRDLAIDLVLRSALSRGDIDTMTTALEFGVSWY
jgi:hypothetical protein